MATRSERNPGDAPRKKILVLGGTGIVGAPIVRALDDAGWMVRVTSRRAREARASFGPGVELVPGDANRPEDLERAMAGCAGVLNCVNDLLDPYLELRVTRSLVKLAPALGVERVGLVSGASVAPERRAFPMIDGKYQAEQALAASGLGWFIVRLTWTMESLARFLQGKQAAVLGRQPATIHPVAGADAGRMVARAFLLDEALGRTFTIHGPQATTVNEWLARYCALVHAPAKVKNLPFWMVSAVATLTRNRVLKAAVELMKYFDAQPEYGDPTEANRILGAPTIALEDWVARLLAAAQAKAA